MKQAFEIQDPLDLVLVHAVQDGLPLVPRPYAEIGERIGLAEAEVRARLARLQERGDIRRLGVVVRHRELGYRANAMVVWDIPDERVAELGRRIGAQPYVNLCYRRPRRPPQWNYNLFCMIHGQSRDAVMANLAGLIETCDLHGIAHQPLFSLRRFKQRGAHYGDRPGAWPAPITRPEDRVSV
jgi:DNA-binding Lrp family transcriptional regulator